MPLLRYNYVEANYHVLIAVDKDKALTIRLTNMISLSRSAGHVLDGVAFHLK